MKKIGKILTGIILLSIGFFIGVFLNEQEELPPEYIHFENLRGKGEVTFLELGENYVKVEGEEVVTFQKDERFEIEIDPVTEREEHIEDVLGGPEVCEETAEKIEIDLEDYSVREAGPEKAREGDKAEITVFYDDSYEDFLIGKLRLIK